MIGHKSLFTGILAFVILVSFANPAFAQVTDNSQGPPPSGSPSSPSSTVPAQVAQCATIKSWDGATQRGGDLAAPVPGILGYTNLQTTLTNNGVTILPGIAGGSLSAAALTGVDVFYFGDSNHILTAAEATALNNFIQSGGSLIVESDSGNQAPANAAFNALGLGNRVLGSGGGNVGGLFQNVITFTTVGPLGDFRGQSFDGSVANDLDDTGHTLVGVNNALQRSWVEYSAGLGAVLGLGDPYGFSLFAADNNDEAITNFVLGNHCNDVVGGELLSIDTTALILAGAQTNAIWIMSALAVIGSIAFGALYITTKKN